MLFTKMLNAECSMPNAQCRMLNAECSMPNAQNPSRLVIEHWALSIGHSLYRHHPVGSCIDWQFCIQAIDQCRTVLVQKVHEPDGALLRLAAWKGLRSRVLELAPQRLVLAFGGLDDLPMELLQIILHSRQRGAGRSF